MPRHVVSELFLTQSCERPSDTPGFCPLHVRYCSCTASAAANVLWKPEPAAEQGRGYRCFWGWILFSANRHYVTVRGRRREKTEVKLMAFLNFKKRSLAAFVNIL